MNIEWYSLASASVKPVELNGPLLSAIAIPPAEGL